MLDYALVQSSVVPSYPAELKKIETYISPSFIYFFITFILGHAILSDLEF